MTTQLTDSELDAELDADLDAEYPERFEKEMDSALETYLRKKPQVEEMVFDFVEYLLLHKPDDVFLCAAEYFASLHT